MSGKVHQLMLLSNDENYVFPGRFVNLGGGDYTYSVTSRDCNTVSKNFTVEEPPKVEAIITATDVTCGDLDDEEKDGTITIEVSGGRGGFTYEIFGSPDAMGSTLTRRLNRTVPEVATETVIFEQLPAGTYVVNILDKNGCPYFEDQSNPVLPEVTIEEPALLEVSTGELVQVQCADEETGEVELILRGGVPPYTITYGNAMPITVPALDPSRPQDDTPYRITGLEGGSFYGFVVTDVNNCLSEVQVILESGLIAFAELTTVCEGSNQTINTTSDINITVPNGVPNNRKDDLFYILDDQTTRIESRQPMFRDLAPGTYTVSVRNGPAAPDNCEYTIDSNFTVADFEQLSITAVVPTGELNEWKVIVSGGVPFDTSNGANPYDIFVDNNRLENDTFVIDVTRPYSIRVEDSLTTLEGTVCAASTTITLEFIDLFIPNYFTPNGDGTYDTWYPENTEFFPDIKVKVFDRYGRLLEQYKGPATGWDGKYEDKLLPSGDYWYLIELNDGERERQFTGHFTLYR